MTLDLETEVNASYRVDPVAVRQWLRQEGIDEEILESESYDIALPIPVGSGVPVTVQIGPRRHEVKATVAVPAAEQEEPSHSRAFYASMVLPVVTLYGRELRERTDVRVTAPAAISEGSYVDPSPSAAYSVMLNGYDLSAGLRIVAPQPLVIDQAAISWHSHLLDNVPTFVHRITECRNLVARSREDEQEANIGSYARWARHLFEIAGEALRILTRDIAAVDSCGGNRPQQQNGLGEVKEDLIKVRNSLDRLSFDLRQTSSAQSLLDACGAFEDCMVRAVDEGKLRMLFETNLRYDDGYHLVPESQLPEGTYNRLVIVYSYPPRFLDRMAVFSGILLSSILTGLVAWRLRLVWPLSGGMPDSSTAATYLRESRTEVVAIFVFAPTILFTLVPIVISRASRAEQSAQAYFFGLLGLSILSPAALACFAVGDVRPNLFSGLNLTVFISLVIVAIGGWWGLTTAGLQFTRDRKLDREVKRWVEPPIIRPG